MNLVLNFRLKRVSTSTTLKTKQNTSSKYKTECEIIPSSVQENSYHHKLNYEEFLPNTEKSVSK